MLSNERMKIGSPPRSRGQSRSSSRSRPSSKRKSPTRVQHEESCICDTTSETYISATKKLSEAAWRYDREKDPGFIHNLENRELVKEDFRRILKIGLDCRLTREELESLMPLYNNHGKVDGFEFILTFYHLRFENRGIQLTARVIAERRLKDALVTDTELRSTQHGERNAVQLIDQVTDMESAAAMRKLTDAAALYDRSVAGMLPLDAFDRESMRPEEFRLHLRNTFNLQFTIPELTSIIKMLNKEKIDEESINCARFLVFFLRLGLQERTKKLQGHLLEQRNTRDYTDKRKLSEEVEFEEKNGIKKMNAYDLKFTPSDRESAMVKLREAAKLYLMQSTGTVSLRSFEESHMTPHVFREQLRRVFKLSLSSAEIGALLGEYQDSKAGTISCSDFVKAMISMGITEHEKDMKEKIEKLRQEEKQAKADEAQKNADLAIKHSAEYSRTFTDEDMENALLLLFDAARRYDKNMPGQPMLEGFDDVLFLEPHVFKDQMQRAFRVKMSPQQIGALLMYFNADENGNVYMATFLAKFFKIGLEERQERRSRWLVHRANLLSNQRKEEESKQREADEKQILRLKGYTEADFQSAMGKLTEGALRYDGGGAVQAGLGGFQNVTMPPHIFKDQLRRVFAITTTLEEIAALMAHFDRAGSGVILCKTFIAQFFKMGVEEKSRLRGMVIQARHEKEEKELDQIRLKEEKQKQDALLAVNFEFTEIDFDSFLGKFVFKCHSFETRELGPLGWASFTADLLSFSDFRTVLKRQFDFRLSAFELGALVLYCYPSGKAKGVMSCRIFINNFLHSKLSTEQYKGTKNENSSLKLFAVQLKEAYVIKMKRTQDLPDSALNTSLKPWRLNAQRDSTLGIKSPIRQRSQQPVSAAEKIRLRLTIGKKSGRMDLSTKSTWPSGTPGTEGGERVIHLLRAKSRKSTLVRGSKLNDDLMKIERIAEGAKNMRQEEAIKVLEIREKECSPDLNKIERGVSLLERKFKGLSTPIKRRSSVAVRSNEERERERDREMDLRSTADEVLSCETGMASVDAVLKGDGDELGLLLDEMGDADKDDFEGSIETEMITVIGPSENTEKKAISVMTESVKSEIIAKVVNFRENEIMEFEPETVDTESKIPDTKECKGVQEKGSTDSGDSAIKQLRLVKVPSLQIITSGLTVTVPSIMPRTTAVPILAPFPAPSLSKPRTFCFKTFCKGYVYHVLRTALARVKAAVVDVKEDMERESRATSAWQSPMSSKSPSPRYSYKFNSPSPSPSFRSPAHSPPKTSSMSPSPTISKSHSASGPSTTPPDHPPSLLPSSLTPALSEEPVPEDPHPIITATVATASPPSTDVDAAKLPPENDYENEFEDGTDSDSDSDSDRGGDSAGPTDGSNNAGTTAIESSLNSMVSSSAEITTIESRDVSEKTVGISLSSPAPSAVCAQTGGGEQLGEGAKEEAVQEVQTEEEAVPYVKGRGGYCIPSTVNGYSISKVRGEDRYLVTRVTTDSAGKKEISKEKKDKDKPQDKNKDKDSERDKSIDAAASVELKIMRRAGLQRTEVYRQSLEERSRVGMLVEFSLASIPEHVLRMTKLTELWLCNNMLCSLPTELSDLQALTVLSVKGNMLRTIPPELGLLSNLKRLYLGGNNLETLPNTLCNLKTLDDLDISSNKFFTFPPVITGIRSISRLNLAGNSFDFLPSKLSKLRSLTLLDLSHTVVRGNSTVLTDMGWTKVIGWERIPRNDPLSASSAPSAYSPSSISALPIPSSDGSKNPPLTPTEPSPSPPTRRLSTTPYFLFPTKPIPLNNFDPSLSPLGMDEGEIEQFLRGRASARAIAKLKRRRGKRSSLITPYG